MRQPTTSGSSWWVVRRALLVRERGARVLRERRGHCLHDLVVTAARGVAGRRLAPARGLRQCRPQLGLVNLVIYIPPAWGSLARDAPCSGMPPLPQAGDGPPSSEVC